MCNVTRAPLMPFVRWFHSCVINLWCVHSTDGVRLLPELVWKRRGAERRRLQGPRQRVGAYVPPFSFQGANFSRNVRLPEEYSRSNSKPEIKDCVLIYHVDFMFDFRNRVSWMTRSGIGWIKFPSLVKALVTPAAALLAMWSHISSAKRHRGRGVLQAS